MCFTSVTIMIFISVWQINPRPQGLIDLWEDYNFVQWCDFIWSCRPSYEAKESHHYNKILSQTSPQLIRILQAYRLAGCNHDSLLNIRLMLNLSWDKLRRAICPLHELIGDNDQRIWDLLDSTSDPALPRTPQCILGHCLRSSVHFLGC
jgi:hypothetical protein